MKYLKTLVVLLVGMTLTQLPDLISIYVDHTIDKYQRQYCDSKKPNECFFDKYFYHYQKDHPTLDKINGYFLLGEGRLYMIVTHRCSNEIFYNPSAAGKDSGKITMREYFYSRCSEFDNDMSDLIWGKK